MRLAVGNIKFVKQLLKNNIGHSWHVAMKSNNVGDSRTFVNYDSDGKTTADIEYPVERLPKTVQKYLENACGTVMECYKDEGDEYLEVLY